MFLNVRIKKYLESLCSSSNIDQRFSVTIQLQDKNTTALSIRMGISG